MNHKWMDNRRIEEWFNDDIENDYDTLGGILNLY